MDTLFPVGKRAAGKNFVGRTKDIDLLQNLVFSSENVALYGIPKDGRKSLVEESLSRGIIKGKQFLVAEVDLVRARSTENVISEFASALLKICCTTAADYRRAVAELLPGTHLVFDEERFRNHAEAVSANWILDEIDVEKVFGLPAALSEKSDKQVIVYVKEFQNILLSPDSQSLLTALEKVLSRRERNCTFVFTGSRLNAMRQIFEVSRCFWRSVVKFEISGIESAEITEYIYKGLINQGKVLEKEIILGASELLKNNMWYVNNLFSIVDAIGKGYINKKTVSDALEIMISVFRPHFYSVICSLTDFQLNLLRAVIDGQTRFSSLSIIDKYQLNSSANVKRIKDALEKKEVLWFDDKDEPHVQDPLFEYWLSKEYFAV